MLKDIIRSTVEDKVNDIFLDFQNKLGIQSGDISPMDLFRLDEIQNTLASEIERILFGQTRENARERVFLDIETDEIITLSELKTTWKDGIENGWIDGDLYSDFNYYLSACMTWNNGSLEEIG